MANQPFALFSVPDFLRQYRAQHGTLPDSMEQENITEPTHFGRVVVNAIRAMTQRNGQIDQQILRMYLTQAPSYLLLDSTMNTAGGIPSWNQGFNELVDTMIGLHGTKQLELETVNAASKACSECWTVAGAWRGLDVCREHVRAIAGKLKTLLDDNGRTFQGQQVYAP